MCPEADFLKDKLTQQRPCEADQLPLAHREVLAALGDLKGDIYTHNFPLFLIKCVFAHLVVQPPLQRRREALEVSVSERGPDPLVRVGPEGVQVGAEGASEQDGVLKEKGEKI